VIDVPDASYDGKDFMTNRAHRTFAIMLVFTLAGSASALGAGPLNGKTYEGGAPSSGINSEGHRLRTHASGNIILRVAGSGRSVTVRFSSSSPILFCNTQQRLYSQSTKPASISSGGAFKAAIGQRFAPGPGLPAIVQVVTGKFSGHTVRGTIHTQAAECSGVTTFSATAR
jgi:hypothetical protein